MLKMNYENADEAALNRFKLSRSLIIFEHDDDNDNAKTDNR